MNREIEKLARLGLGVTMRIALLSLSLLLASGDPAMGEEKHGCLLWKKMSENEKQVYLVGYLNGLEFAQMLTSQRQPRVSSECRDAPKNCTPNEVARDPLRHELRLELEFILSRYSKGDVYNPEALSHYVSAECAEGVPESLNKNPNSLLTHHLFFLLHDRSERLRREEKERERNR